MTVNMSDTVSLTNVSRLLPHGFVTTLLFSLVVFFLYKSLAALYNYRWRISHIQKFPGLRGHWLLGGLVEFPGPGEKGLKFMRDRLRDYPKMAYMFFGPFNATVAINHPEPVKSILKTSEPKPTQFGGYFNALPWLGEGLLIAGGMKWARNRRLLTPAFHFDILKPYIAVNNRAADVLIEKLTNIGKEGDYFEVFNLISLSTLEVILKCALSYKEDIQREGAGHPYVRAVQELAHAMIWRILRPWYYPNLTFYLSSVGRKFRKNCDYVHSVADDVIRSRQRTLKDESGVVKSGRYLDFLDILLTARDDQGKGLTNKEIRDEVDTFLFEGHDTTASGISWTLYSLAQHKDWQRKCQQEIDEILDGRDSDYITWDDLPDLKVLTMCVKEGLRLHAPVPVIQRITTKDMYIDGYFLPAGTQTDIHIYNILHNPTVWDEPMEFRPERFSDESNNKMDSFAFIPFSAGPRNCIGQNFAMHEMKVLIGKLLRNFNLEVDPSRPAKHELMVVMKTESGMYIKATPRDITK